MTMLASLPIICSHGLEGNKSDIISSIHESLKFKSIHIIILFYFILFHYTFIIILVFYLNVFRYNWNILVKLFPKSVEQSNLQLLYKLISDAPPKEPVASLFFKPTKDFIAAH